MKAGLLALASAIAIGTTASTASAEARIPTIPTTSAKAYVVFAPATGTVLAARAPHRRLPMASLTKLMTVLVALDHLGLDDLVFVSPKATTAGGSSAHLRAGEQLTVRELVTATLVQSANDAADALADAAEPRGRAAFVAEMNAKAAALGMADTHYVNPDGLDAPGHVSSATDVLRVARAVVQRPYLYDIMREQTATLPGGRLLHTWNALLGVYPGVFGVKTGHTDNAGYCQVVAARRGTTTVYAVILGAANEWSRDAALEELLDYGFSRVSPPQPAAAVIPVPTPFWEKPPWTGAPA